MLGLAAAFSCWAARAKHPETTKVPFRLLGLSLICYIHFHVSDRSHLRADQIDGRRLVVPPRHRLFFRSRRFFGLHSHHRKPPFESSHPAPLFKNPIFSTTLLVMFLIGMALFGSISVMANYMIRGLQYEKYVAGKLAMSYGFTQGIVSIFANLLSKVIPLPLLIFSGLSVLIYSYFLNNELSWLTGPDQIIPILILRGIGASASLWDLPPSWRSEPPPRNSKQLRPLSSPSFVKWAAPTAAPIIAIFSIRKAIFHFARWSEQTSENLPGYQATFFREIGDKDWMTQTDAKLEIIRKHREPGLHPRAQRRHDRFGIYHVSSRYPARNRAEY